VPIFLKSRLLLIHIPKCGGDTVTHHLGRYGDQPFLFVADGSVMVNGHTPQHMTWLELLKAGWHTPPDFRVAALVRHPVDRVISEFHYIRAYRPDLKGSTMDPSSFLDQFLRDTPATASRFDNHNLEICDFLSDLSGEVNATIDVYPAGEMDRLVQSLGLPNIRPEDRRNVTRGTNDVTESQPFSHVDLARITERYRRDIDWLQARFPKLKSDWLP